MIQITDIKKGSLNNLLKEEPCIYFIGEALDERGEVIASGLKSEGQHFTYKVIFDVNDYSVSINDERHSARFINNELNKICESHAGIPVVIDSTTLDVVELLYLIKWFKSSNIACIEMIYIEPENYKRRANYMSDYGKHEFDLSAHSGGFKAIPGFSQMVNPQKKACLVSVLGFERSRLGQLMQIDEGAYIEKVLPIFATPSFQTGWDKHSFYQNVETLNGRSMKPEFVSADSPLDMINTLNKIKSSFSASTLMISPFGSKPLSIGVAVFLVNNLNEVILKFDHPLKKKGRSTGIGCIHCYKLEKHFDLLAST